MYNMSDALNCILNILEVYFLKVDIVFTVLHNYESV